MKKKNGMSIAAVLGIMICLVSTVTTCFILAIRSSILTSRSLKYIESYNNASSEIDNAISFIESETNTKFKNGVITGAFVTSMCDSVEGLFGVDAQTSITDTTGDLDMQAGFVIMIQAEYTKINTQKDYLVSVVNFSATMSGGKSVITSDLAIDKETVITTANQLLKTKYNSTNLLWDYWTDQYDESDEATTNAFIDHLDGSGGAFESLLERFNAQIASSDKINIVDGKFQLSTGSNLIDWIGNSLNVSAFSTSSFISYCINTAENRSNNYGVNINDWNRTDGQPDVVHSTQFDNRIDTEGRPVIVINKSMRFDKSVEWTGTNGTSLYVTNNSVLFIRGSFKTDANIYIERGSTLLVKGNLTINDYTYNGAQYAPVLDGDLETSKTKANEAKGNNYIGGGIIVQGNLDYSALDGDGVLLTDNSRYNYETKLLSSSKAYINGGYTVSGKVKLLFNNKDNNADTKLPAGATIYNDDETSLSNIAFMSTTEKIRPFLLFCNGSINIKFCCSLVDGKTKMYTNDSVWEEVADKKCGFAIITCEKLKTLEGCNNIVFMNMFYNSDNEITNDKSDNLLQAAKDMQGGTEAYAKYGVYNGFVNANALAACSDHIEADSVHWYIPDKLRGSMIAASISASEAKRS